MTATETKAGVNLWRAVSVIGRAAGYTKTMFRSLTDNQKSLAVAGFGIAALLMAHWLTSSSNQKAAIREAYALLTGPTRSFASHEITFNITAKVEYSRGRSVVMSLITPRNMDAAHLEAKTEPSGVADEELLFQATVTMNYGCDLKGIDEGSFAISRNTLVLELPHPELDTPRIEYEGAKAFRRLDYKSNYGWLGRAQSLLGTAQPAGEGHLEQNAKTRIQSHALDWANDIVEKSGLREELEEQSRSFIMALLMPILTRRELQLEIRWIERSDV